MCSRVSASSSLLSWWTPCHRSTESMNSEWSEFAGECFLHIQMFQNGLLPSSIFFMENSAAWCNLLWCFYDHVLFNSPSVSIEISTPFNRNWRRSLRAAKYHWITPDNTSNWCFFPVRIFSMELLKMDPNSNRLITSTLIRIWEEFSYSTMISYREYFSIVRWNDIHVRCLFDQESVWIAVSISSRREGQSGLVQQSPQRYSRWSTGEDLNYENGNINGVTSWYSNRFS